MGDEETMVPGFAVEVSGAGDEEHEASRPAATIPPTMALTIRRVLLITGAMARR